MTEKPAWLAEPELQHFFAATRTAGGEARAVGGAVRDFLMGHESGDVDIASTLLPEQTIALAERAGWKAVPTGIAHGTVTLVLPQRLLEVTTLRRDEETDGRHAVVAYTDRFEEDAARRDFTLNALYMNAEGEVFDFFRGQEDAAARRIRFIGDAATRITEDALRILRFFRFLASHGTPPADSDALAAIAEKTAMIEKLSGERIAAEMRKLLSIANPAYALRLMQETGAAKKILGRAINPQRIIRLHMLEAQSDYQASVWARALVLLPDATKDDAAFLTQRWKLARHETTQLQLLASLPAFNAAMPRHAHTRLIRLHGAPAYLDWLLMHAALGAGVDVAPYVALAQAFTPPVFPVTAKDLMAQGMQEGKALGDALAALENRWETSDYQLTKDELLRPN